MKTCSNNKFTYYLSLIFFLNYVFFIGFYNHLVLCSNIPLYPTPEFTKVEKICNELCSDLEAITFNKMLHYEWVENSDYLLSQFLHLNDSINNLVNNSEESRSYLLEDIHYLLNSITTVELRYSTIYSSCMQHSLCQSMSQLLHESKMKLNQLLSFNQEIIG